ncbi:MAG: aldehyde dehydrogenase EutE [Neisseriales bacterium]|nr:MAG: aldehyde dehydrogenase EutE [Neisseriales bacterium]
MALDAQDIEKIVRTVVETMKGKPTTVMSSVSSLPAGIFNRLDDAVAEAMLAQRQLGTRSMRALVIEAIRQTGQHYALELAQMAVSETGMGRVEDKVTKNISQAKLTPGIECLSPAVIAGDHGLTLIENAAWGVIASVTPSTNPAATIINNAISMIASGNTVVFAPHPAAKKVSQHTVTRLNEAIVAAGGPKNTIVTVAEPNIEVAQQLFRYPGIRLLVVTGGEAVVRAARKTTDKRLIAAGAGNPPVVVDESADIVKAAQDIVWGASFDNNIVCVDEKEAIVVSAVCDALKAEMTKHRAVELSADQLQALQDILLTDIDAHGAGSVNRDWVGRDAAKIARAIGLTIPDDTRLLFAETSPDNPFAVSEQMMPILPIIRVDHADQAIDLAVQLENGHRHTASMHSKNIDHLDRMANEINTSIFVKNGPCLAGLGFGGEGWTSMTISTPTGEGVSSARTFVRLRRCVLVDHFRVT